MNLRPTLLLCSETDDLADLRQPFEQAAAELCPELRVALWSADQGLAALQSENIVGLAAWLPPLGLPARLPQLRLLAQVNSH